MKIMYPKKVAIGVDIGGTKIKAGLVDANGQIIGVPESKIGRASCRERV